MEVHTFPLAEEAKEKLENIRDGLRSRMVLREAKHYLKTHRSAVWIACGLMAMTGYCIGRTLTRE
jgi:hypothetical protein